MITISKGNAEKGASYFSHDDSKNLEKGNYYIQEEGRWYGTAANELGLSETVTKEQFFQVLRGYDLDGSPLTRNAQKENQETHSRGIEWGKKEEGKRVAYTDVTISAPKSVSLVSVIDSRVKEAHRRAVESVLNELEQNYSLTRTGTNGVNQQITGSMAIATFTHEESRELDVQLHTHCVIVNATKRADGKWGALENRPIVQDQKLLDLMYQAQLTRELNELGYETVRSTRKGMKGTTVEAFEIAGISSELIDSHSNRTAQVHQNADEQAEAWEKLDEQYNSGQISKKIYNRTKSELMQFDKLNSRKWKDLESSSDQLLERRESVKRDLADFEIPARPISQKQSHSSADIVQNTVNSLAETEAVFDRKLILKHALKNSIGSGIIADELSDQIESYTVKLPSGKLTTPAILEAAERSIEIAKSGRHSMWQRVDLSTAETYLREQELAGVQFASTQRETIKTLCSSTDMVNILQGNAGTGKTFAVSHMKSILESEGFRMRGLAPTGKAAEGLSESGLESCTLDSFFLQNDDAIHRGREIWVVDECSMVGNINMAKLLTKAQEHRAKVILLGDIKQLQAVSAGRAFGELQDFATVTRSDMTEVIRQKSDFAKEIVAHSTDKCGNQALELIADKKGITISDDPEVRLSKAMKAVFDARESRQSVVLLTQTNASRERANSMIREKLVENGTVDNGADTVVLSNAGISAPARLSSENYRIGIIVNFNQDASGIIAGTQAQVTAVDQARNSIQIKYRDRKSGEMKLQELPVHIHGGSMQLYETARKNFGAGDEIIFLKNDKALGVSNGVTGKIKSIENGQFTVALGDREISFNEKQYRYFDHGYALTNHKAQGATFDRAVILCDDARRTNAEEWYVGVTRARYDVTVITDNLDRMKENVQKSQPKESVLEHRGFEKASIMEMESILSEKLKIESVDREQRRLEQEQKRIESERIKAIEVEKIRTEQALKATEKVAVKNIKPEVISKGGWSMGM